jgi:uncharacterized protein with HEPN domain
MKGDKLYLQHILDAIDTISRYVSVGRKQSYGRNWKRL